MRSQRYSDHVDGEANELTRWLPIQQELSEDLLSPHPVDVALASSQEAGDRVPLEVVDPADRAELAHAGVDPGESCASVGLSGKILSIFRREVREKRGTRARTQASKNASASSSSSLGLGSRT